MRTHVLQEIIEGSPDLIAAIDADFRFLTFNAAYRDAIEGVFGTTIVLGMSLLDALKGYPQAQADARRLWGRAIAGETFTVEHEFERRTYHITLAPLHDPDGRRIGASQIARDVSDRVRSEAQVRRLNQELVRRVAEQTSALRLSEERFRTTFENAPIGIAHIDMEGRWLRVNRRMAEITGYSVGELRNTDFQSITHPDDLKTDLAQAARLVAGEIDSYQMEKRYIRRDGSVVWALMTGTIIRSDPPYFLAIIEDISARKAADGMLRAAKAEAERASMAKTRFLAAASHDLRQPAQSLALFTAVLEQRLAGTPEADVIVRIQQSIEGLHSLLDSMLDVSKLDAGLVVPAVTDVPLDDLLRRLAGEFSAKAEAAGVHLRRVPTTRLAKTDPALLERILRNLIDNAIRYTPAGGRVLVGCRRCGSEVSIQVVDTGIGIPAHEIDAVFEEYHQLGNPARDRTQGLGLGLSIVARLSRLLRHPVTVASVPERGSCFAVAVPETDAVRPPAPPVPNCAVDRLVLVIDDEDLVRTGLVLMLEGWGFRAVGARNGDEAMAAIEAETPAAILADYRLAEGEVGTELVGRLRERLGSPVPALVLTGDTAPERIAEAARSGIAILHKPIAANELKINLASLLAG